MLRSAKGVLPASWWPALALLALAASVRASDSDADDPTGKTLYSHLRAGWERQSATITEPACSFYKCLVTWRKGATVAVNWLGPPPGNVSIELVPVKSGTTYTIVSSYPSISQEGYCDGGYGLGVITYGVECGRVEFKVPSGWSEVGNYSIAVTSLRNDTLVGYTDLIRIAVANSSTSDDAPDGTSVSLLTIPSPTSTNFAGSTSFDGKIPSPTTIVTPNLTMTSSTKASSSSRASTVSAVQNSTSVASPATSPIAASATQSSSSTLTSAVQGNSISASSRSETVPIMLGIRVICWSFVSLFCL